MALTSSESKKKSCEFEEGKAVLVGVNPMPRHSKRCRLSESYMNLPDMMTGGTFLAVKNLKKN